MLTGMQDLLTVYHQTVQGHLRPYALAVSLPDEVSGVGLAAAADISHLCVTQHCNIYFQWQQIPYSMLPTHYMHDGHGFTMHIIPRPRQAAVSSGEASQASRTGTAKNRNHHNQDEGTHASQTPDRTQDQEDASGFATDTSMPDELTQFEHWQGVQIYRLGKHVVHCFVRWGTYNSILRDIALFLREHLRNLVGSHNVQAMLAGQHEAEDSVILQYVNDFVPGSTEQLIILDVEVHFQTPAEGFLRAPEVSRHVHRIVPHVSHTFVLRLARLAN